MEIRGRLPVWLLAALCGLVVVASGNLSGLGIGAGPLLYDTIALPRFVVTLVLTLTAWAVWSVQSAREGTALRGDRVWLLLAALAAWAVASALVSPHRALAVLGQSERLEGAVTVVLYALVYGITLQVIRRMSDTRVVLTFLGAAAAAVSAFGLVQFAGFDPTNYAFERYGFEMRRAFATFGNPNFLAGALALTLPILVALALTSRRRIVQLLWALGALAATVALFATFTRGAWLAALVEAAVALWVWWRSGRARSGAGRWLVLSAVLAMGVLLVMSLNSTRELNLAQRLADIGARGGSADERVLAAGSAWNAALARPAFGYGPDTFLPTFRAHRTDGYVVVFGPTAIINNAHSWPVQYAATLGFVGALLLVASVVAALWRSRRFLDTRGASGSVVMAAAWIGCAGFTVHMLFSVAVLGATVPFWVLLGVLGAPGAQQLRGGRPVGMALTVCAVLAAAISVFVAVMLLTADSSYLASRDMFVGSRQGDPLVPAARARTLNPTSVKYARGTAQASAARVESAIMRQAPPGEVRALYRSASSDFVRVLELSPGDYPAYAWYAALSATVGTYLDDVALLERAHSLAEKGARFDRHHYEIRPLIARDYSSDALSAAASVPPLP